MSVNIVVYLIVTVQIEHRKSFFLFISAHLKIMIRNMALADFLHSGELLGSAGYILTRRTPSHESILISTLNSSFIWEFSVPFLSNVELMDRIYKYWYIMSGENWYFPVSRKSLITCTYADIHTGSKRRKLNK